MPPNQPERASIDICSRLRQQADLLLRTRAAVVDAAESPERKTHGEKTKSRFTTDPTGLGNQSRISTLTRLND